MRADHEADQGGPYRTAAPPTTPIPRWGWLVFWLVIFASLAALSGALLVASVLAWLDDWGKPCVYTHELVEMAIVLTGLLHLPAIPITLWIRAQRDRVDGSWCRLLKRTWMVSAGLLTAGVVVLIVFSVIAPVPPSVLPYCKM